MNTVILKGNLTRDPEVKEINSNGKQTTVANFSIAVSRFYRKANGESAQETEFIDCEAWDTGAVTIGKILSKGDPVLIRGALKTDKWEKDGQKHQRTRVRIETFDKLGRYSSKKEDDVVEEEVVASEVGGEDIPF